MESLLSGNSTETSFRTCIAIISFLLSIMLLFINPNYLHVLITLELLDNSLLLTQAASNAVLKFLEAFLATDQNTKKDCKNF